MGRSRTGKGGRGAPRKYDWSIIKKLIQDGKTNTQIAAVVGCTSDYVGDLRWKFERRARRCQ